MARFTTALVVSLLAAVSAAAQPKPGEPAPKGAATPEAILRLREEVELIEAQLETKKAYVKAAELAAAVAEREFAQLSRLGRAVDATAVERAKTALEAAKAQLDIRKAEANEVAVKLKHAKRRAEDAAKAPAAVPGVPATKLGRDVQLQLLAGMVDAAAAKEKAYRTMNDEAKADLERAKKLLDAGAIKQTDYDVEVAVVELRALAVKQAEAASAALRGALDELSKRGSDSPPDRKQLEADVERTKARLKVRRAMAEQAKAKVDAAKAEVERLAEAAKRGPVSREDLAAAGAVVTVAEINLASAREAVTYHEDALKRARQLLDATAK